MKTREKSPTIGWRRPTTEGLHGIRYRRHPVLHSAGHSGDHHDPQGPLGHVHHRDLHPAVLDHRCADAVEAARLAADGRKRSAIYGSSCFLMKTREKSPRERRSYLTYSIREESSRFSVILSCGLEEIEAEPAR